MSQCADVGGPPGVGEAQITRLVPDQWAAYRQARLAALTEAPYAFSSTLDQEVTLDERRWRQRIESAATFMAWRDGQPVGTATGLADRPGQGSELAGSWQLVAMWVDPSARGSGVAGRLVDAVARHARAEGAPALTLWVTDVNDRARAFYLRLGFRLTGVRGQVRPTEHSLDGGSVGCPADQHRGGVRGVVPPDQHWEELMIRDLD